MLVAVISDVPLMVFGASAAEVVVVVVAAAAVMMVAVPMAAVTVAVVRAQGGRAGEAGVAAVMVVVRGRGAVAHWACNSDRRHDTNCLVASL